MFSDLRARYSNHRPGDNGFTIVELMIAMSVFTIILVATSAVLVQIGRAYYRSVFTSRTQSIVRSVADNVSRSIQFSGSHIVESNSPLEVGSSSLEANALCIGTTRYTYILDNIVGSSDVEYALWRDNISTSGTCDVLDLSNIPSDNDGVELLGQNMRLLAFSVEPDPPGSQREYRVRVDIAYGESDFIEGVNEDGDTVLDLSSTDIVSFRCKPASFTLQFCAASSLSSKLTRRL